MARPGTESIGGTSRIFMSNLNSTTYICVVEVQKDHVHIVNERCGSLCLDPQCVVKFIGQQIPTNLNQRLFKYD